MTVNLYTLPEQQGHRPVVISSILIISIVIDSDRGHCYEHLKNINLQRKLSVWHVFECLCTQLIFELKEIAKN